MPTNNSQNMLALPTGAELGKYRLLRTLGQGGFGITYLAEDIATGEKVVIKENLPTFCAYRTNTLNVAPTNPGDELQEYPKLLTRFVEEARLLAQLDHPNIVKVLGAFEALGTAYYVMPWVGGKELHKAAPAAADITEEWLRPVLRTMLGALSYLHSLNIYHRDVKPANILLTDNGTPILIDFGTARAIISDRSATLVGSPGYSPIEQITPHGKRGPWTDVYSLGAACYRLITGERPPDANERLAEDEDPLRPLTSRIELRGRFSTEFLAAIDKAMSMRARNRWQTAADWLAVLPSPQAPHNEPISLSFATQAIAIEPITHGNRNTGHTEWERPTEVLTSIQLPQRKRNVPAIILGGILVLVLAIAIPGAFLLYQRVGHTPQQITLETPPPPPPPDSRTAEEKLRDLGIQPTDYQEALTQACKDGKADIVGLLIAAGVNVNEATDNSLSPLSIAACNDHTECVKLLLAAPGIEVNKTSKYNYTALHYAISSGKTDCVKLLLSAPGIDVNTTTQFEETPILEAIYKGHKDIVQILYRHDKINLSAFTPLQHAVITNDVNQLRTLLAHAGTDVNQTDANGYSLLTLAAMLGHTDCITLLLQQPGIEVNHKGKNDATPLYCAARSGKAESIRILLKDKRTDINTEEHFNGTPLIIAAENGHSECLQLLLNAPGIDPNITDTLGKTALALAAKSGHPECVRLLLSAPGIDCNKKDQYEKAPLLFAAHHLKDKESFFLLLKAKGINKGGTTPLHIAAKKGDREELQKQLSLGIYGINQCTDYGATPLSIAICSQHTECIELLLKQSGIDVNAKTGDGTPILYWAIQNNVPQKIVELLLQAPGIDVNQGDAKGWTPLYLASFRGDSKQLELLLSTPGIDVNKETHFQQTPLSIAAEWGQTECVKRLLRQPGIKVNTKQYNGKTPLTLAEEKAHTECAELIRAAGGEK